MCRRDKNVRKSEKDSKNRESRCVSGRGGARGQAQGEGKAFSGCAFVESGNGVKFWNLKGKWIGVMNLLLWLIDRLIRDNKILKGRIPCLFHGLD